MGNIFVNGRPVCDDYADRDNNAAVVVCRFTESSSLNISAPNHTMPSMLLISVTPSEIEVALPEAISGWIDIQYYIVFFRLTAGAVLLIITAVNINSLNNVPCPSECLGTQLEQSQGHQNLDMLRLTL